MSVKIAEPPKISDLKPEDAKPERPKQWNVVLHNKYGNTSGCSACILREVFNKNDREAYEHAVRAIMTGSDVVFASSKDVAEQKAADAEASAADKALTCHQLGVYGIRFSAQP